MYRTLSLFLLPIFSLFGTMHHHCVEEDNYKENHYTLKVEDTAPFDELIITWNAKRPKNGAFDIYVRVQVGKKWSPWLLYARWTKDTQFANTTSKVNQVARVFQDTVNVLNNHKACAFEVRIISHDPNEIKNLDALHICTSNPSKSDITKVDLTNANSSLLGVDGISQMAFPDERGPRLCSPTSTYTIIDYLSNDDNIIDPIAFAESVFDQSNDIFDNWVFNVASAYHHLPNSKYACWVERLNNFSQILSSLDNGFPVVISVKGPLKGSASPYKDGHLLAVIGFDAERKEVFCIDPAFKEDQQTFVTYKLNDLLEAWNRRKGIAYMFNKKKLHD